ncbi:hypothetical protein [Aeromonas salmonicida]|uniref:hypothetical protein n=1 Tax=Aeromonas salmonicida TaxID=645 RepID=UPI001144FD0F|nr:hypothetical protein [Aeromonas salmonicida]
MDSSFVDLDILTSKIRNSSSKKYFLDTVKAYKSGALRASLTSAWVALVYDLIAKYRELSAHGEVSATNFIQTWDNATTNQDLKKLLELEKDILIHATETTQILNSIDFKQLSRLREDRHLCAHPAYSAEAELFEPSSELVRLHMVNVVDLVLAREPRQGRAIFEVFSVDVQSVGFPTRHEQIVDYVEQRYLQRVRMANISNFGVILAKSLIKGVPMEWEVHDNKIVSSLVAVRDRNEGTWQEISTSVSRLIDNLEPEHRSRAIAFLARFPAFWALLQEPTKIALQETANNIDPSELTDYRILIGVTAPQFRDALLGVIAGLDTQSVLDAISQIAIPELWGRGIDIYRDSGSFRGSEDNFRQLVLPFYGRMGRDHLDALLNAVSSNGQNWHAAQTPSLLATVLQNVAPENRPAKEAMDRFYAHCRASNITRDYNQVFVVFTSFGWTMPVVEEDQ